MKPLPLPRIIQPGKAAAFTFHLAAPQSGWKNAVRLRVQFDHAPAPGEWHATFNGEPIPATTDVSEPFPVAYPSMMGAPDELRAWTVPAALLREGANKLELTGPAATILFLDLADS